ncbi:uncharacterized protein V6R79_004447 [Siganus canaliculatus]
MLFTCADEFTAATLSQSGYLIKAVKEYSNRPEDFPGPRNQMGIWKVAPPPPPPYPAKLLVKGLPDIWLQLQGRMVEQSRLVHRTLQREQQPAIGAKETHHYTGTSDNPWSHITQ